MSEYRYYGWQAIDRPLTMRELDNVARLSSHMDEVSTTHATVTYYWGDFKHDPIQVLYKYFDIFLYDSNFSHRRLAFRIPKKLLDPGTIEEYLDGEFIALETHNNYHLLEFNYFDDTRSSDFEYVDSDQMLYRLEPLRDQLIRGDFRALYIIWLLSITQMEGDPEIDDILEPPVPSGLNIPDIGILALIEFFGLDPHLVSAAAGSTNLTESSLTTDLSSTTPILTHEQMEGHPSTIVLEGADSPTTAKPLRTAGKLLQMREILRKQEQAKAREEAERNHIQKLEDLSAHQEKAWEQVAAFCQKKSARAYDQATQLLCDLHELSKYKDQPIQYRTRFNTILNDYGKSTAFKNRLRRAGLLL